MNFLTSYVVIVYSHRICYCVPFSKCRSLILHVLYCCSRYNWTTQFFLTRGSIDPTQRPVFFIFNVYVCAREMLPTEPSCVWPKFRRVPQLGKTLQCKRHPCGRIAPAYIVPRLATPLKTSVALCLSSAEGSPKAHTWGQARGGGKGLEGRD